jgi:hypothetical protein
MEFLFITYLLIALMNYPRPKLIYTLLLCLSAFSCEKVKVKEEENIGKGFPVVNAPDTQTNRAPFKDMLGINAFEWNFLQNPSNPNDGMQIYEPKMQLIKSFAGVRHYLDWGRIEQQQGNYTFSPTHSGGWNLDVMYQRCKAENIDLLVCLKTCPDWLLQTYPGDQRDAENVPMPYGADKKQPKSYVLQAKAAFQLAARYGSKTQTDLSLVSVNTTPRWTGDQVNTVKTGLNLVKYIECDNERDKWWKGDKAYQTAEEYAANLSAFYDGHKGALGKGVGVKAADPNMQVVMAGLAKTDINYVAGIINWCKNNRGYKADGTVDLCFDVINFHLYSNDHASNGGTATTGIAPELSEAGKVANEFVTLGQKYNLPVWVTEAGYDVNEHSPQRAIAIGNKSALLTQADWTIRTSLLYARNGIKKVFYYMLYDDNLESWTQYASSGFITGDLKRRPSAEYVAQVKSILGNAYYQATISQSPLVDVYKLDTKTVYALVMPTQTAKSVNYDLKLPGKTSVTTYTLRTGYTTPIKKSVSVTNGVLRYNVSETPVFIEVN